MACSRLKTLPIKLASISESASRSLASMAGQAMPDPVDYYDLPHVWGRGFYAMDQTRLIARLAPSTKLTMGDVKETVRCLDRADDPIGFISFDLDYYSSTKNALAVFDLSGSSRRPRVYCYFDDIICPAFACHNPWTGELRAIREFNEEHTNLKLFPLHLLRWMRPRAEPWNDQIYILHDFQHPLYATNLMHKLGHTSQKPLGRAA
jgi:hypothetical protein